MKVEGTIQERVSAAVEFLRARRSFAYDRDKIAEAYRKAGVPFTAAADKFFEEWHGVFCGDLWSKEGEEGDHFHKEGEKYQIDFYVSLFDREEEIRRNYRFEPVAADASDDEFDCDFPALIRKHFGADTVPVGEGGYYYQGVIYITPEGTLVIFHPDYDEELRWEYDSLPELLWCELQSPGLDFVEKIVASSGFSGPIGKRCLDVVKFARTHGGFGSCRLFRLYHVPLDIGGLPDDPLLSDDELAEILLQRLMKRHREDESFWDIAPELIWQVEE